MDTSGNPFVQGWQFLDGGYAVNPQGELSKLMVHSRRRGDCSFEKPLI